MRSDALGMFWRDEPPKPKEKVEKPKCVPPERTWERPDYLPGLEEAKLFNVQLYSDDDLYQSMLKQERLIYDIECYPNYFLIAFKGMETGKALVFETQTTLSPPERQKLEWVMKNFCTVGYNSNNFDNVLTTMAIAGKKVDDFLRATEAIIIEGARPYDVLRSFKLKTVEYNHIDLIEVAPLRASLKIYGGRVHTRRMQDLPFPPGTMLSDDQIAIVRWYCVNDLLTTNDLYAKLDDQIHLREEMSKEYGIDLRSKSDAQIAEAVISHEMTLMNGSKPRRPEIAPGTMYRYNIPNFIYYQSDLMNWVLGVVRNAMFVVGQDGAIMMPVELADLKITIGFQTYKLGIGGLHSTEKCQAVRANDQYLIEDRDVTSYYPFIILNQGLYPQHLGPNFLRVYRSLVDRRLAAKTGAKIAKQQGNATLARKSKKDADSLKIVINGSYGKLSSMWSALYAPQLQIQTTITGQLALLMLIEAFEVRGIHIVSANTDGIVIYCPRDREQEMNAVVKWWEMLTNFETEGTRYRAVYSRDVNNYIAVYEKPSGDDYVKTKGQFSKAGLSRNPTNEICIDAIEALLVHGTPVATTVHGCTDIRKFVSVRKVKGGAVKDGEYLGGSIRWYYAAGVEGAIIYAASGKKVPKSDGAKPLMTLPDEFPSDVNYDWYIEETYSMLADLGYV